MAEVPWAQAPGPSWSRSASVSCASSPPLPTRPRSLQTWQSGDVVIAEIEVTYTRKDGRTVTQGRQPESDDDEAGEVGGWGWRRGLKQKRLFRWNKR